MYVYKYTTTLLGEERVRRAWEDDGFERLFQEDALKYLTLCSGKYHYKWNFYSKKCSISSSIWFAVWKHLCLFFLPPFRISYPFAVETFWWTLLYLFCSSIPLNMVCMQTSWHVVYDDYVLFQYFSYPIFCHLSEIGRKFTMGMLSLKKKNLTVGINSRSVSLLRHKKLKLLLISHFGSGIFCSSEICELLKNNLGRFFNVTRLYIQ